ncbi:MAG: hypothetical protein PVH19_09040 [Planctomycetia bacterium]|jgi:hypothetical protein
MAHYKDLEPCDYFGQTRTANLVAVGWLEKEFPFTTGEVPHDFYLKLSELLANLWSPIPAICMGVHECTLCQFEGPAAAGNLYIPYNCKILVAPELILHYINCHHYRPPDDFITGVMQCPDLRSMEYKKLFLANGGNVF